MQAIFVKLREAGVNVVISTEHVYKDPQRAYRLLKQHAPHECTIIPGMEYVTKEDIDVILFAKDESIYQQKDLMKPFALTYEETVDLICNTPGLHGFVTHPFTLGDTSIITKKGEAFTKEMINKLGAVEASYTVFSPLTRLLRRRGLRRIAPGFLRLLETNEALPEEYLPESIKFLAAGSDAHDVCEIGVCVEVPLINDNIFESVINNKTLHISGERNISLLQFLKSFVVTIQEWRIKCRIRKP